MPALRLGYAICQVDGFEYEGEWLVGVSARRLLLILILLLVKEGNNVGNVGDVAQSEKSSENSQ